MLIKVGLKKFFRRKVSNDANRDSGLRHQMSSISALTPNEIKQDLAEIQKVEHEIKEFEEKLKRDKASLEGAKDALVTATSKFYYLFDGIPNHFRHGVPDGWFPTNHLEPLFGQLTEKRRGEMFGIKHGVYLLSGRYSHNMKTLLEIFSGVAKDVYLLDQYLKAEADTEKRGVLQSHFSRKIAQIHFNLHVEKKRILDEVERMHQNPLIKDAHHINFHHETEVLHHNLLEKPRQDSDIERSHSVFEEITIQLITCYKAFAHCDDAIKAFQTHIESFLAVLSQIPDK